MESTLPRAPDGLLGPPESHPATVRLRSACEEWCVDGCGRSLSSQPRRQGQMLPESAVRSLRSAQATLRLQAGAHGGPQAWPAETAARARRVALRDRAPASTLTARSVIPSHTDRRAHAAHPRPDDRSYVRTGRGQADDRQNSRMSSRSTTRTSSTSITRARPTCARLTTSSSARSSPARRGRRCRSHS